MLSVFIKKLDLSPSVNNNTGNYHHNTDHRPGLLKASAGKSDAQKYSVNCSPLVGKHSWVGPDTLVDSPSDVRAACLILGVSSCGDQSA